MRQTECPNTRDGGLGECGGWSILGEPRQGRQDFGRFGTFSVIGIELGMLKQDVSAEVRPRLQALQDETLQLSDDVRRLSHELHPSVLEHLGLVPALEQHCAEFAKRFAVDVTLNVDDAAPALSVEAATALYRIVQESLHNAVKHGQAQDIWVRVTTAGRELCLSVVDDGCGFEVKEARDRGGSLGLASMDERASLVGGRFSIVSELREGTRLEVRVPLAAERESA